MDRQGCRAGQSVDCLALTAPVDYLEPLYAADADELLDAVRELSARDDPPHTVLLVVTDQQDGVRRIIAG